LAGVLFAFLAGDTGIMNLSASLAGPVLAEGIAAASEISPFAPVEPTVLFESSTLAVEIMVLFNALDFP
jgi:hypothetical protein